MQQLISKNRIGTEGKGIVYVLLVSLIFGLMPAVTQMSFRAGLSVETMLAGRYVLTLLLTWVYIRSKRIDCRIRSRQLALLLTVGLVYSGVAVCINQSYLYLPGSIASVLVFLYVSMTLILTFLSRREPVSMVKILCVLLSLAGMLVIIQDPSGSLDLPLAGLVFVFLAAFFYSIYSFSLGTELLKEVDDTAIVGYILIIPSIANVIRCLVSGQPLLPADGAQLGFVLILAVFCTFLAQVLYCKAVKAIGSASAAIINTQEPVIAYGAGMVLMGELLPWNAWVGGGLILTSVILLNTAKSSKHPLSQEQADEYGIDQ